MQIHTTKGLIDKEQLVVKDIIDFTEDARVIATEWYLEDELVRRDVNVNILRGLDMSSKKGDV